MSESERIAAAQAEAEQPKKEASAPKEIKIKTIDGRALIIQGVVEKITNIPARFGYSSRIEMNGKNFYYNSKIEHSVDKIFKVGSKAAFTVKESVSSKAVTYLVIDTIFYTF